MNKLFEVKYNDDTDLIKFNKRNNEILESDDYEMTYNTIMGQKYVERNEIQD